MSAPNRILARITHTVAWTYVCLSVSIVFLGLAFQVVYATVTSDKWQMSQGFPVGYYIMAILSLVLVGLAKLGKPANAPKVTIGALLSLLAIVLAMLSFDFQSLVITPRFWIAPPFWITLVGGLVSYISLFFGWRSDAAEKKLQTKIKGLEAEIQVRDEVIEALEGKFPSPREVAVLIAAAISVSLLGVATERFYKRYGGQR